MKISDLKLPFFALLGLFLYFLPTAIFAQDIVVQRQTEMKMMASKMNTIVQMLRGQIKYDSETVGHGIDEMIKASGSKLIERFLDPKWKGNTTTALWSSPDKFEKNANDFKTALMGLKKEADLARKAGLIEKAQKPTGRGSFGDFDREAMQKAMTYIEKMRAEVINVATQCRSCHTAFLMPPKKFNP